jgi:ferrous iron transport protein B
MSLKVVIAGNPNCGKSSLFNQLTGLNQKTANFPGVTVEKKTGEFYFSKTEKAVLTDLPGAYSLYPNTKDERIVVKTFLDVTDKDFPDLVIYVADVNKLDKHFLLFTQLKDLGIPIILALNMKDLAKREGLKIDVKKIENLFDVPVCEISSRTGEGIEELKRCVQKMSEEISSFSAPLPDYKFSPIERQVASEIQLALNVQGIYRALLLAHHKNWYFSSNNPNIDHILAKHGFEPVHFQVKETMSRFDWFTPIIARTVKKSASKAQSLADKIDSLVIHKVAGPILFLIIMVLVFQAIFALASYPMDWIEILFAFAGSTVSGWLPDSWISNLITDGLLAGLGGILVFIPQIAILFFLISILEEIGYMARAAFLFDRLMQTFGLNGRSLVALISGGACAIPAIMSTRTIPSWKERMITIMVTPLISCSARIPVYTLLIGFSVPAITVGIFNLQGLAFMGLYLLGILAALISAIVFKWILKTEDRSYLLLELPNYRTPVMRNVLITVYEKVKSFTLEAGKVIILISIVLWGLANYGPGDAMEKAEQKAMILASELNYDEQVTDDLIASYQIEASYAGILGKTIEPIIAPLGFDWKMGIAIITSFAAREVFVGTMATIYSIGSADDEATLRERMEKEVHPITGEKVYSIATSISLLLFYVFAMQCMSTLAVVKRETNSWKWPIIQFVYMTLLAFFSSFTAFQLFST